MPKVNFYLLKEGEHAARQRFACRLAEQQARLGNRVHIVTGSAEESRELDLLLWEFTAESFLPHAPADSALAGTVRVTVGETSAAPAHTTCLLNLQSEALVAAAGVAVVAEFVLNDEADKARSRQLWQRYKQQGCDLQLHPL
jgi:DNA polymerase IIIc chi subunit